MLSFAFRGPRIIQEISESQASIVLLQELNNIDNFYDEKLKELGFSVVYGMREINLSPGAREPHTIAIAYKSSEWILIDTDLYDMN